MKKILHYLNPLAHLGDRNYPIIFPIITISFVTIALEYYVNTIVKNPQAVGMFAIFLYITLIVYFAFRAGVRGGLLASTFTIFYYLYIIYSRHYTGDRLESGINTTIILGILYTVIALIIGWLKQRIDVLIENEANEKHRLQAILQQLPAGVIVADRNGNITFGNKKVETILGTPIQYNSIVGVDTMPNATHAGKAVSAKQWPLAQALETGKSILGKEYTIEKENGKRTHVQISATAIHNTQGKLIAAASIITDITQQKELEERKDDFVNMASHELKTPITSMKLYMHVLAGRVTKDNDERVVRTIQSIEYQIGRLQNLVNDLLDVSRLQTGKLSMQKEEFNITELIHETIESLQGSSKQHEIIFSNSKPVAVYADKYRVSQVLTNLLTNAIKYSPQGTDIQVKQKAVNGKLVVSVTDNGIGIDKNQQKRIFDRLYQVTGPKEKTFPGLGMGLYISQQIVHRHKGSIWVESERDKGSTFYFSLPLKEKPKQKGRKL